VGAGPEGERNPTTHNAKVAIAGTGTVSVTATVLTKIYIFRCSKKSDLLAVTRDPTGNNLPPGICTGHWTRLSEAEVEQGGHITGFVSRDLFRDLDRQGFHIASGIRATVSLTQHDQAARAVGDALSAANMRTGFFTTDTDA
jgi:hypothetical protein